ncbi:cytidine deaminase [Stackebrandtia soli]|uniref:cytidine deaminase n=1 Tax=Stackebrandtia soli TaxID=1892856 RepID=UPI0039EC3D11
MAAETQVTLSAEDAKLLALAKTAAARVGAPGGASVRDEDGRSYTAADVNLPSLKLSALQLAVAQAVAAGATGLEAALVVATEADAAGVAAVRDVSSSAPIYLVAGDAITKVAA